MDKLKNFFKNNLPSPTDLIAILLVFMLPVSSALPNILLIPFVLIVIFDRKKKRVNWTKSLPIIMLFTAVSVITFMAVFNHNFVDDINFYSRFFLIFIVFYLFYQVSNTRLVEHFFLFGVIIAIIGSSITIGLHIYHNPNFILGNGAIVNKVLWLERPYFGFLLAMGVFICLKNAEKLPGRYDYYLLSTVFIAFTIYISARLAIGLDIFLILVFLFRSYAIGKKTKAWVAVILVLLISVGLGLSNNLMTRMKVTNDFCKTKHLIKDYEPRFVIWPCAFDIIENDMNLFTGLKSRITTKQKLTQCYGSTIKNESKRNYYLERKFNTHNQFLSFLMLGGVFPLIFLILMFITVWLPKKVTFEQKVFFILFFAFFLVENVLYRQLGCYLCGIFMALYSNRKCLNE